MTQELDMQITGVGDDVRKAEKKGVSPVLIVGALVAIALATALVLKHAKKPSLASGMPEAPALLAVALTCAEQGPVALARASEAEQSALAKAERYAFDAHDGVDAVRLYGLAQSCYAQGGDSASAQRARKAQDGWTQRMNGEYQSHRLRLRLALDRGATTDAYREAHGLTAMLRGHTGPYLEWLSSIERAYKPIEKKKKRRGTH